MCETRQFSELGTLYRNQPPRSTSPILVDILCIRDVVEQADFLNAMKMLSQAYGTEDDFASDRLELELQQVEDMTGGLTGQINAAADRLHAFRLRDEEMQG